MPALTPVQSAEATLAARLRSKPWPFSTEFSTKVLKTLVRRMLTRKKPPEDRAASKFFETKLSSNLFEQLLVDVEVRVDVLDIVVLFKCLHQPDHGTRLLSFQLDVILWNEGDA